MFYKPDIEIFVFVVTFVAGVSLCVFSSSESAEKTPKLGWTTSGYVVNVVDGDTVDVEIRKKVRVRLLDCWAPESRTKNREEKAKGVASKKYLRDFIEGEKVVLHIPTNEEGDFKKVLTFNRVLGKIYFEGEDVSEKMVSAGHAKKEKN